MLQGRSVLEDTFKAVWEKARTASSLISQLKEEKGMLNARVAELEGAVETLKSEMLKKEQEFKRLGLEHAQFMSSHGNNVLTADEKENLKNKIRDLIAKINSYL